MRERCLDGRRTRRTPATTICVDVAGTRGVLVMGVVVLVLSGVWSVACAQIIDGELLHPQSPPEAFGIPAWLEEKEKRDGNPPLRDFLPHAPMCGVFADFSASTEGKEAAQADGDGVDAGAQGPRTRFGFAHVYSVQLRLRRDHFIQAISTMERLNAEVEVFWGEEMLSETVEEMSKYSPVTQYDIARYLSHTYVLQDVVAHGYATALLLDGAFLLSASFRSRVEEVIAAAHANGTFDLLNLSHCSSDGDDGGDADIAEGPRRVEVGVSASCLHGYAVSQAGARKLVKALPIVPKQPFDAAVTDLLGKKELLSKQVRPGLVGHVRDPLPNLDDLDRPAAAVEEDGREAMPPLFLRGSMPTESLFAIEPPTGGSSKLGADHVYVLNLRWRRDRFLRAMSVLQHGLSVELEIFPAVPPFDSLVDEMAAYSPLPREQITRFLSHLYIYRDVLLKGYGTALILDGDLNMDATFRNRTEAALRQLPPTSDFDVLFLCDDEGFSPPTQPPRIEELGAHNACLAAYVLTHRAALRLTETLPIVPMTSLERHLTTRAANQQLRSLRLRRELLPWSYAQREQQPEATRDLSTGIRNRNEEGSSKSHIPPVSPP